MGNDTQNDDSQNLGNQDPGTITGSGQNPVNPPANNPPFPDPVPTPDPAPASPASGGGSEDDFLKYVKMANDLHWVPGILKTYGADNELPFGKVEEEEYVEDDETCKLIFPEEYWHKQHETDDAGLDEETYSNVVKKSVTDDNTLDEELFNDEPGPVFESNDTLDEDVFPGEYWHKKHETDDADLGDEVFGIEDFAAESAAAESPLNGEDETLEMDTFNEPKDFADTYTHWVPREIDAASADGEKVREMLMKLLPSEDAEGAVKDPEWTFGKFMKEKFPDFVASDRAAMFLDLVAQYSVVDAVERLAVMEAKQEIVSAAAEDADQDELLAQVQELAETKRKQYLTDYVMPPSEGEPAKYRKFWKEVVDIVKAL